MYIKWFNEFIELNINFKYLILIVNIIFLWIESNIFSFIALQCVIKFYYKFYYFVIKNRKMNKLNK